MAPVHSMIIIITYTIVHHDCHPMLLPARWFDRRRWSKTQYFLVPQCRTQPLEQAAEQASPSRRHCFLSAAAEITFVFKFVIPSSPPPHLPPLIVIPHPPSPFHLLCQAQQACGFPAWSQNALNQWTLTMTFSHLISSIPEPRGSLGHHR